MSSKKFRGGVPVIQFPVATSTSLGVLLAADVNVTAVPELDNLNTSVESPLPAGTYQVHVGFLGRDGVNQGYTIGECCAVAPAMAVTVDTSNTAIKIQIDAADIDTAGGRGAAAMAVFLIQGSTDPQLAGYYVIPPTGDFVCSISTLPVLSSPFFESTLLADDTSDPILGSRDALAYTFVTVGPTQDGVDERRTPDLIQYRPDNGGNFSLPSIRSVPISFAVLPNQMREIVRAAGGSYSVVNDGDYDYYVARMSHQVVSAISTGNVPLRLIYPPFQGTQEIAVHLDRVLANVADIVQQHRKNAASVVNFQMDPSPQDDLLDGQNAECRLERKLAA